MEEKNEERVEEANEHQNETKKGKKILIITLVLVALIVIGVCVYLLLKSKVEDEPQAVSNYIEKKDLETNTEKESDETIKEDNTTTDKDDNENDNQNKGGNNVAKADNKKEYKSKDGKYTFRIVDRSELKPADDADVGARTAPYYAYLNDHPIGIEKISDDGKGVYYTYKGWFYELVGRNGVVSIVVDSRDNTLIFCPYSKPEFDHYDEVFSIFSTGIDGMNGGLTALNIDAGEFFIRYTNSPNGANLLYTKDWKELGWILNPEFDNDGIYAYDSSDLTGNKAKYDSKGNKTISSGNGKNIAVDGPLGVITLELDSIEKSLISKVNNNTLTVELKTNSTCKVGEHRIPGTKKLDTSAITKVINKLKEANNVEYMPTSKICVLYNFHVGSEFIAFEADDPTVMLVGINGEGFAFHFDESVIDFFKSL